MSTSIAEHVTNFRSVYISFSFKCPRPVYMSKARRIVFCMTSAWPGSDRWETSISTCYRAKCVPLEFPVTMLSAQASVVSYCFNVDMNAITITNRECFIQVLAAREGHRSGSHCTYVCCSDRMLIFLHLHSCVGQRAVSVRETTGREAKRHDNTLLIVPKLNPRPSHLDSVVHMPSIETGT